MSFKKINVGTIQVDAEVNIQQLPSLDGDSQTLTTGSLSGAGLGAGAMPNIKNDITNQVKDFIQGIDWKKSIAKQISDDLKGKE